MGECVLHHGSDVPQLGQGTNVLAHLVGCKDLAIDSRTVPLASKLLA